MADGIEPVDGVAPVAILIVTYNSAADLPGFFDAVRALEPRPRELVVVDCDSRDGSVEIARGAELGEIRHQVYALGENRGFSGGMNAALRHSTAPFVLALNADAAPSPDFLDRLLIHFVAPRTAAATGRLVRPVSSSGERLLDACGMHLHPAWRHFDRGSGEPDRGQLMTAEHVFGGTGAATLYRRTALEDVAFPDGEVFDELFHSYREDAELCFRFHERGWRVVYEPRAVAEHRRRAVPSNRRTLPKAVNRHSLKNRYLLRAYHQTRSNLVRTLLPATARDLAALIYVLLIERSSFAAYLWLWRHRRTVRDRRRYVQSRRTAPDHELERWFTTDALPLTDLALDRDPAFDGDAAAESHRT
ncbi:MAG: glycosyltransferase [Acidobacteriota bacterium]